MAATDAVARHSPYAAADVGRFALMASGSARTANRGGLSGGSSGAGGSWSSARSSWCAERQGTARC